MRTVREVGERELVLDTYLAGAGARHWLLSADGEVGRLIESFSSPKNTARRSRQASPLVQWLRPRLVGGRLAGWRAWGPDVTAVCIEADPDMYQLLAERHREGGYFLVLDRDGAVLVAWPLPDDLRRHLQIGNPYLLPSPPGRRKDGTSPLSRWPAADRPGALALDQAWQQRIATAAFAMRRKSLLRAVHVAQKQVQRRLERITADLEAAQQADTLRTWGELLKIHGHTAPSGAHQVTVPDEFSPDRRDVVIPLDAQSSVAENIARLFRRYRRLRDALPHIQRRWEETRSEGAAWAALEEALGRATTIEHVEAALQQLPGSARGRLADRSDGERASSPSKGTGLRRRISADGLAIWVGRASADNDRLTFRLGNGRDWWLHAVGVAGSHVLVRNPGGGDLPRQTLLQAAWLAAHYSKGRAQGDLEVMYTQIKHVRKPKGAKPGEVSAARGRTLWVKLDDPELRKILDAPAAPEE